MSDDINDKPVTTSLRAGPQQLGKIFVKLFSNANGLKRYD